METIIYEYCILRYVPDIERGEFLNIGVLMMCKRYKWIKSEIRINSDRICALFKNADISTLRKQIEIYRECDVPFNDSPVEERYRWMSAVKSAIIQTSPSHPGIIRFENSTPIEKLEQQFDYLTKKLL